MTEPATALAPSALAPSDLLPAYFEARAAIERAVRVDEAKDIADRAAALTAYAIQAKDRHIQVLATEVQLRAERRAGQILIAAREAGRLKTGRPKTVLDEGPFSEHAANQRLRELGINKNQSARWQRRARVPEGDFERGLEKRREPGADLRLNSFLSPAFSSAEIDYLTPREVLDAVRAVMGEIDLDPAAETRGPRANVPARGHFTKKDDGLSRPWHGRVFLNPPYGKAVGAWVGKFIAEAKSGRVTNAILLVASRPDTEWFRALGEMMVCFVAGRLRFRLTAAPAEAEPGPAPFPSAILYMGPDPERFASSFAPLGPIYARAMAMAVASDAQAVGAVATGAEDPA